MERALPRRKALHRLALTEQLQTPQAQDEQRRAATGYLFWPAALFEHYAEREPASSWYRIQIRQAMRFGLRWLWIGLAALVWPLVAALLIANTTGTIVIYVLAIVMDAALFVVWLRLALRYSKLAARGETFNVSR